MESLDESISHKVYSVLKTSKSFVFLLILSITSLITACFVLFRSYLPSQDIIIEKHGSGELVVSSVTVDISGEVKSPGVYTLADGSRLKDAIEKAGGFTTKADGEYIAQSYNLARVVKDGEKIYIPPYGAKNHMTVLGEQTTTSSSMVNINTADVRELDKLTSVGKITAEKIIAGRPYTSIEELVEKEIVSKKVFEKIKTSISTY